MAYWTGNGWSSPISCRTWATAAGVASVPAAIVAGSPGTRWSSRKMPTEESSRTGTAWRMRRATNTSMEALGLHPGVLQPDHLGRRRPERLAVYLRGRDERPLAARQRHRERLVEHEVGELRVELLPFSGVQLGDRLLHQLGVVVVLEVGGVPLVEPRHRHHHQRARLEVGVGEGRRQELVVLGVGALAHHGRLRVGDLELDADL